MQPKFSQLVTKGMLIAVLAYGSAAQAQTAESDQVLASVTKALKDFSEGKVAEFKAAWAPEVEILDDVAPYLWTGANSLDRWLEDTGAEMKATHTVNAALRAEVPRRIDVTGDSAYMVLPVIVSYQRGGVPMEQRGTQSLVFVRKDGKWLMRVMAYAGERPVPVAKAQP